MHRTSPMRTSDPLTRGIPSTRASEATRIPQNTRIDACIVNAQRRTRRRVHSIARTRAFDARISDACKRSPDAGIPPMRAPEVTRISQTRMHRRMHPSLRIHVSLHKGPYLLSPATIYHLQVSTRCQLLHQATIQLDDVALKKSTKEHGYYIAVTSLNKIDKDSCMKRGIFLKSESFESIFLSRRQHELISNTLIRSSSVNPDSIDRRKQMPVQDPEARHLS